MAVRLVRKAAETASISNRDDACMVRYAYGYDGIVQNFAGELEATVSADKTSIFLAKGKVVLNGWEMDIDEETFVLSAFPTVGTSYSYLYVELNLLTETSKIAMTRSSESVFPLSLGDDLTHTPNGTARLCLYRFSLTSEGISAKQQIAPYVPYLREIKAAVDSRLSSIESRLAALGFKSGTLIDNLGGTVNTSYLHKQGKYVVGKFSVRYGGSVNLPRGAGGLLIATFPEGFKPNETIQYVGAFRWYIGSSMYYPAHACDIVISPFGITLLNPEKYLNDAGENSASSAYPIYSIEILLGYKTT